MNSSNYYKRQDQRELEHNHSSRPPDIRSCQTKPNLGHQPYYARRGSIHSRYPEKSGYGDDFKSSERRHSHCLHSGLRGHQRPQNATSHHDTGPAKGGRGCRRFHPHRNEDVDSSRIPDSDHEKNFQHLSPRSSDFAARRYAIAGYTSLLRSDLATWDHCQPAPSKPSDLMEHNHHWRDHPRDSSKSAQQLKYSPFPGRRHPSASISNSRMGILSAPAHVAPPARRGTLHDRGPLSPPGHHNQVSHWRFSESIVGT